MPDITLVIVNYFSAELTRRAISSAKSARSRLRVIVVDNSCDPSEARALESAGADELIVSPDNSGYGGGANRGVAAATTPVVVVSNPDVVFGSDCLDLLAETIVGDVAVAGPAFHWDEGGRWMLPPVDLLGSADKVSQVLASRSAHVAARRGRARAARRIEFWRRAASGPVDAISGAVMAVDRRRFEAVGGFDQRYELYFEEIDLVRRLNAKGWSAWYAPSAHCRHLYNQSASLDPESSAKFLRSEATYLKRWAGIARPFVGLGKASAVGDETGFREIAPHDPIELPARDGEWLVEATPLSSFESAAGCFAAERSVTFPPEIWSTYRARSLYLRIVDPSTLEIAVRFVMRK